MPSGARTQDLGIKSHLPRSRDPSGNLVKPAPERGCQRSREVSVLGVSRMVLLSPCCHPQNCAIPGRSSAGLPTVQRPGVDMSHRRLWPLPLYVTASNVGGAGQASIAQSPTTRPRCENDVTTPSFRRTS
jgi:hypothetical protein